MKAGELMKGDEAFLGGRWRRLKGLQREAPGTIVLTFDGLPNEVIYDLETVLVARRGESK